MTQQQFIQEFRNYPQNQKSVVIRQLLQIFEADLEEEAQNNGENGNTEFEVKELSVDEKMAIVESLAGSLKMENPPMTKEEVRELITEAKAEKYK